MATEALPKNIYSLLSTYKDLALEHYANYPEAVVQTPTMCKTLHISEQERTSKTVIMF